MRLALHQSNFVPWRPFFAKMAAVDIFVVAIHYQFERSAYQQRFNFQNEWYTLSVCNVKHLDLIRNKRYVNPVKDWQKIKRRLPQFGSWFDQFDDCLHPELYQTNYEIIQRIAQLLSIKTRIVLDMPLACKATDRLIEICHAFNATTYLSGRSGAKYLEAEKFDRAGIALEYQTVTDTRHVFEP